MSAAQRIFERRKGCWRITDFISVRPPILATSFCSFAHDELGIIDDNSTDEVEGEWCCRRWMRKFPGLVFADDEAGFGIDADIIGSGRLICFGLVISSFFSFSFF